MDKRYKLCFIGGGINSAIGTTHFIASQMDNLFTVDSGFFSRNLRINKETAKKWNISEDRVYDDLDDMLNKESNKVNAFVILTPTPEHYRLIKKIIEYNVPIITEKAMATSIAKSRNIIDLVGKSKSFLCVTFNYTGYPMIREIKKMIIDKIIGELTHINIEMPQEGYLKLNDLGVLPKPQTWRLRDYDIPTVSLDLGTHLHNLIYFLTNELPISVISRQNKFSEFNVVDNVQAIVTYTNDLECRYWFGKSSLGHGNGLKINLYGTKGSIQWYQNDPENIILCDKYGSKTLIDRSNRIIKIANQDRYNRFKSGHPSGFIEAFANYYYDIWHSLEKFFKNDNMNNSYTFSADTAHQGLLLMDCINKSAKNKEWLNIENN